MGHVYDWERSGWRIKFGSLNCHVRIPASQQLLPMKPDLALYVQLSAAVQELLFSSHSRYDMLLLLGFLRCVLGHRISIRSTQALVLSLSTILSFQSDTVRGRKLRRDKLTCHFANLKSISPRLSACSLGPSLRDRRTPLAATARYRL